MLANIFSFYWNTNNTSQFIATLLVKTKYINIYEICMIHNFVEMKIIHISLIEKSNV